MDIAGQFTRTGEESVPERSALNGNYFQLGIYFLLQHALDCHQRAGEGTRAASARALVADAQCVVTQSHDFEVTTVAHQRRSYFFVQNLVDSKDRKSVV